MALPNYAVGGAGINPTDYMLSPPLYGDIDGYSRVAENRKKDKMLDADLALRNRLGELDAEFKNATAQRKHEIELERMRIKQQQTEMASEYNYDLGKIGAGQATGGQIERALGELGSTREQGNKLYQEGARGVRDATDSGNRLYQQGYGDIQRQKASGEADFDRAYGDIRSQKASGEADFDRAYGDIRSQKASGEADYTQAYNDVRAAGTAGNALFQQGYGDIRNQMGANDARYAEGKGYLTPAYARYQGLADNGMYTRAEYDSQLKSAYGDALNAATTHGANLNTALASRGLGGNPYAAASMGLQGQFAAQGARGQARAGLDREQAQSRVTGIGGMASVGGQLSALGQAYAAMNSGLATSGAGMLKDQAGYGLQAAGMGAGFLKGRADYGLQASGMGADVLQNRAGYGGEMARYGAGMMKDRADFGLQSAGMGADVLHNKAGYGAGMSQYGAGMLKDQADFGGSQSRFLADLLSGQAGYNAGISGSMADYMTRPTQDNTLKLLSGGGAAIGNVPGGVAGGGGKPPEMKTNAGLPNPRKPLYL